MTVLIDDEVYFQHYGVKGMRWGVRNEERGPNRLSRKERSKSHQKKADETQSEIDAIGNTKNPYKKLKVRSLKKERDKEAATAKAMREGKLTPTQKKVAIGAAVVGVIVGTAVTVRAIESGQASAAITRGKQFIQGKFNSPFDTNPRYATRDLDQSTLQLIADGVNDYGAPGSKNNCRRCTMAMELRRRGHQVRATRTLTGLGQDNTGWIQAVEQIDREGVPKTFTGGIWRSATESLAKAQDKRLPGFQLNDWVEKSDGTGAYKKIKKLTADEAIEPNAREMAHSIFDALAKEPNRSRGELSVSWLGGRGGHSMFYEIVDGVPVIFDTQTGKRWDSPDIVDFMEKAKRMSDAGFTRLDDKPLNMDFIRRWVTDG